MISSIEINSLEISAAQGYSITKASGFGGAEVRLSSYNIASRHRAQVPRAFWGVRKMQLEITIVGSDSSDYQNKRDNLLLALDTARTGLSTMEITTITNRQLQIDVQVASVDMDFEPGQVSFGKAIVGLIAPDPIFYGQTLHSQDVTTGSSPDPFVNAGNAPVYPTLKFYGTITNPTATNVTKSEALIYTGTITAPAYVTIETEFETAIHSVSGNVLDKLSGTFWQLQPGTNSIGWSGGGPAGAEKLRIIWRDGWVGI